MNFRVNTTKPIYRRNIDMKEGRKKNEISCSRHRVDDVGGRGGGRELVRAMGYTHARFFSYLCVLRAALSPRHGHWSKPRGRWLFKRTPVVHCKTNAAGVLRNGRRGERRLQSIKTCARERVRRRRDLAAAEMLSGLLD